MGTNLQNRIDDPADPPKADEDGSVEAVIRTLAATGPSLSS
jgi:hypothetical protein